MENSTTQNKNPKRTLRPRRDNSSATSLEPTENSSSQQSTGAVLSLVIDPVVLPTEEQPHRAQPDTTNTTSQTKTTRHRWTREEYAEVMRAHYCATLHPTQTSATEEAFIIWRQNNPNFMCNMTAGKLANTRRDILRNNRLTDVELEALRQNVEQAHVPPGTNSETTPTPEPEETPGNDDILSESATPEIVDRDHHPSQDVNPELLNDIRREWEKVKYLPMDKRERLKKLNETKVSTQKLKSANRALGTIIDDNNDELSLTAINQLIYATASVVSGRDPVRKGTKAKTQNIKPKWQRKIEAKILEMRRDLSIATEIKNDTLIRERKRRQFFQRNQIDPNEDIDTIRERIKQQLQAKSQRLRRCNKRVRFFRQNKLFKEDAKRFYRELGKNTQAVEKPPEKQELEDFWSNIWEREKKHNDNADWIKEIRHDANQEWANITTREVEQAIRKSGSWKAPGLDGIANFWLKKLPVLHSHIARSYNNIIEQPDSIPTWLTQGITFLLPKNDETHDPKNYRPITCLPTLYKILTSVLSEKIYFHLEQHSLLPSEQKGCRKGSYGCKDQLLINKMILEDCTKRKKNLSTSWIDYRKAFDSVPHSWIIKSLELYNVHPSITNFIAASMKGWKTTMNLSHSQGTLESRTIKINRGIFQGDSLSPLLFVLSLAPLSELLDATTYGYKVGNTKYNHLLYMDDIKLFSASDSQQTGLLKTVKKFSDDIQMEFGLDKCAKVSFHRGSCTETNDIQLDTNTTIRELNQDESYKYLGVCEGTGIQHEKMKDKIRKEYYRRVRLITRSELNSLNKFQAINSLAVPVITYSFNILNWQHSELDKLDTKTRKILTMERMHHPRSDVHRLYQSRAQGGRGLIQIANSYKTATLGLAEYLRRTDDPLLRQVYKHECSKKLYSVTKEAEKFSKDLNLTPSHDTDYTPPVTAARNLKVQSKTAAQKQGNEEWKNKALHGKYPQRLQDPDVDESRSLAWLRSAGLKSETEGFIIAAQDQSLKTKVYKSKIIKDGSDPLCRLCHQFEETIDHLTSGCPVLAKTEYLHRHNRIGTYIHWLLCRHYGIETTERWYDHEPKTTTNSENATLLWDMPIWTERKMSANRPDIVIKDHKSNQCTLIDVSVPSDRNTSIKTSEKLSKYKDLEIDIQRMWKMRTKTVPIIMGALGIVPETFNHYTSMLPVPIKVSEVQKVALLGTAHILRRALSTQ